MLPHSMRDLPKIRDSISYLYLEYGRVEQTKLGVEYVNKQGRTVIPAASVTTLMLGPGIVVTHGAVTIPRASGGEPKAFVGDIAQGGYSPRERG